MPVTKKITDLALASVAAGDDVPIAQGGFLKRAKAGQASGLAILDSTGMVLDSAGRKIVVAGSNANGTYVRFADGTQICFNSHSDASYGAVQTGEDTNYRFRSKTWVFPASFSTAPVVVHTGDVAGARVDVFSAYAATTTQVILEAGQYNTTSVTVNTSYSIAIGRWY